jgi:hypothetical protein
VQQEEGGGEGVAMVARTKMHWARGGL